MIRLTRDTIRGMIPFWGRSACAKAMRKLRAENAELRACLAQCRETLTIAEFPTESGGTIDRISRILNDAKGVDA